MKPKSLPSLNYIISDKDRAQALGSGEVKNCPFCGHWAFSCGFQNEETKLFVYQVLCNNAPECSATISACYETADKARGLMQ